MKAKQEKVLDQSTKRIYYFPVPRKASSIPTLGCQKIRQIEDRGIF